MRKVKKNQNFKMKKYLLMFFIMLGSFAVVKAQDGDDTRAEKIKSLKIAFITQKLQLSADEAQKFWPIYDKYENDINRLRLENKNATVIDKEEKLLNIRKKYLGSFEKVIGPQRVNKLFTAEKDFRSILIQRLKNRNQQRLEKLRH
jgi:hypothetical protein